MKPPTLHRKLAVLAALALHRAARLAFEPASLRSGVLQIVFSKDRAFQLDALLRSESRRVEEPARTIVLHASEDAAHVRAYEEVLGRARAAGRRIEMIRETSFRRDLLETLGTAAEGRVVLLVDDLLWRHSHDWRPLALADPLRWMVSLRLGPRVTFCQPLGMEQRVPTLIPSPFAGWLTWPWSEGEADWRFATALDGAVFDRRELFYALKRIDFRAPNSLEWALGQYARHFRRRGLCAEQPRLVNLPLNGVQTESFSFPHGGGDPGELLEAWKAGWQMDLSVLDEFPGDRTHAPLPVRLERRPC
jgi:hypothetical protein